MQGGGVCVCNNTKMMGEVVKDRGRMKEWWKIEFYEKDRMEIKEEGRIV